VEGVSLFVALIDRSSGKRQRTEVLAELVTARRTQPPKSGYLNCVWRGTETKRSRPRGGGLVGLRGYSWGYSWACGLLVGLRLTS
jgi:hypothetical protein